VVRHLRRLKELSLYGHRRHDLARLRRRVTVLRVLNPASAEGEAIGSGPNYAWPAHLRRPSKPGKKGALEDDGSGDSDSDSEASVASGDSFSSATSGPAAAAADAAGPAAAQPACAAQAPQPPPPQDDDDGASSASEDYVDADHGHRHRRGDEGEDERHRREGGALPGGEGLAGQAGPFASPRSPAGTPPLPLRRCPPTRPPACARPPPH
jgi:hypothetical protein